MKKAATKPAAAAPAKVAAPAVKPEEAKPAADAPVAAAYENTPVVAADETDAIWVRAKKGVARRCRSGLVFGPEAICVRVDDLTQDQLDAIEADPLLEAVWAAPEAAASEKSE